MGLQLHDWVEIALGFVGGAASTVVVFVKFVNNSKKTTISQSGNSAGGNIIGISSNRK